MLVDLVSEFDTIELIHEVPDGLQQILGLIFARFRTCSEKVFQSIPSFKVEAIGVDYLDGLNRLVAVMWRNLLGHAGL